MEPSSCPSVPRYEPTNRLLAQVRYLCAQVTLSFTKHNFMPQPSSTLILVDWDVIAWQSLLSQGVVKTPA